MRKIGVCLSKGGVGKTTTAVNLSAGLAKQGKKVLLLDLDSQGQASEALGVSPEAGLAELIEGASPKDVIIQARESLWLIGGGRSLAGLKRSLARQDFGAERAISKPLAPIELALGLDFVIMDFAPSWDSLSIAGLFYAQEVLAPVSLEALSLKGLMEFASRLRDIQEYHTLALRYVLPTFLDGRVRKSEELLAQLRDYAGEALCHPIRYNVKLSEAPAFGQTIFEYAPSSQGALDYRKLVERILSS